MAMTVVLQDERCNQIGASVHDPQGVIALSLPDLADGSYSCVRFIDPYGDTVFNSLQAAAILEEWDRLKPAFKGKNAEELWADVRDIVVRCSEEPHTYIKFIGD